MKTIALVNSENLVINIVLFDDDADNDLMQTIAEKSGATAFYDLAIYGSTIIGGDFFNGKLWHPKPYPSWLRGENAWEAPVLYPQDGKVYVWDETIIGWKLDE